MKNIVFPRDSDLLQRCGDAWMAGAEFRGRRRRHLNYTYGKQWCDPVSDPAGNIVEEGALIAASGKRPLTNNLIRQLVKTIVGRFREAARSEGLYATAAGSDDARNCLDELDARLLEEFVISGCAVQRVVAERRPGGTGVWIDNVDPDRFFVNAFRDPRGLDIDFLGMCHEMSPGEVINRFCRGSRSRAEALRYLYSTPEGSGGPMDSGVTPAAAPFYAAGTGKWRVIECWELRGTPVTDAYRRHSVDMAWHCTWLAPDGSVLAAYRSPFPHGSHPFAVKFYPLTAGEVHSFVEDVIDQQRTINRLVVLIDTMMAYSAKGALLYPLDQLPHGVTLADVARMWNRPDAVIPVVGMGRELPRQMVTNTADSGACRLLDMQLKLFEDVSGISDALLGRNVSGATGASLYDAQVANAAVTLSDLLATFRSFMAERSAKASRTV